MSVTETIPYKAKGQTKERKWTKLSFDFVFNHSMETVYFATWYPYTHTQLWDFLKEWEDFWYKAKIDYFERSTLCKTIGGVNVPIIKIHEKDSKLNKSMNKQADNKQDEYQRKHLESLALFR